MEDTDPVRVVNSNPFSQPGALRLEVWAEILEVKREIVFRMFRRRNVPVKRIGHTYWAQPADVWSSFDFSSGQTDQEEE